MNNETLDVIDLYSAQPKLARALLDVYEACALECQSLVDRLEAGEMVAEKFQRFKDHYKTRVGIEFADHKELKSSLEATMSSISSEQC